LMVNKHFDVNFW